MSRAELEPLLFDAFPRETARALMALARPAIRVWPQPLARIRYGLAVWRFAHGREELGVADNRGVAERGGIARLNQSPQEREPMPHEPNWFLGQINCVDLKDFAAASMLPEHGILSFFGDSDLVTGCIGP